MSRWVTPITDRTLADIQNRTVKAFLNVSDWVRIHGNTQQVQALIRILSGFEVSITSLSTPTVTHFPTAGEINSMIADIDRLREAACLPPALGVVTLKHDYQPGLGAAAPDYEDVNAWEQDLLLIRALFARAAESLIYCGAAGAGQPRFWQNRWRRPAYIEPDAGAIRTPRTGSAVSGSGLTRQNGWRKYA
ncbi:MAG TPA: hypothetical protein VFF68_03010 [Anaerolineaceae bacterium]|nr:hypothetical protein [Anaerolineaceae bacterium]